MSKGKLVNSAMPIDSNPRKAQAGWPPVVVCGIYRTGVNLMRDLVRRGVAVTGIDYNPRQTGFRSKYGSSVLCPNPDGAPSDWLSFMRRLAASAGAKPVLIPTSDAFVSAMARHREELSHDFLFFHDSAALQEKFATKEEQYELARANGMCAPRTRFARSHQEVVAFAVDAQFPCLIKPKRTRDWEKPGHPFMNKKVAIASSPDELAAKYGLIAGIDPEVVVQEIAMGPDTAKLYYLCCYSHDGKKIGASMARVLRTSPNPMLFGTSAVSEPAWDAEAVEMCDAFLRRIGYRGLCEIELKRDSRGGKLMFIEANARYTASGDFAHHAGVDLAWLHYLDLIGKPVTPVTQNGRMFRHIDLVQDFGGAINYHRAGLLTWRKFIWAYRPPVAFFDLDLRDGRLALETFRRLARLAGGYILRSALRKKPAQPLEIPDFASHPRR